MSSQPRVLFIGHDASRTGAPMMLLHLLGWMRQHADLEFDLVLRRGGPLTSAYAELSRVLVVDAEASSGRPGRLAGRVRAWAEAARYPGAGPLHLRRWLAHREYGLVCSNTVTNGDVLRWVRPMLRCPVVCWAHEVETFLQSLDPEQRSNLSRQADEFIAVCEPIAAGLRGRGVPPDRIHVVPGFLHADAFATHDAARRRRFRDAHGIPQGAVLVGACGSLTWLKGYDVLVQVARALTLAPPSRPMHFAWLGGTEQEPAWRHLRWDVERLGLSGRFSVIASAAETPAYFDSLDIFALPSRNDPLPLVAMEAGAAGLPVVCFEGNAEMVDTSTGIVVPYLDLDAFARAVRGLAEDGERRRVLGEGLATRIRARHDVAVGAPRMVDILRRALAPVTGR